MNFPWKKAQSVFKYSNYLPLCQKSEKKLMSHFWEKCQTVEQTDNKKIRLLHYFALEIFDLKIQQSDWPRAFWVIYQEPYSIAQLMTHTKNVYIAAVYFAVMLLSVLAKCTGWLRVKRCTFIIWTWKKLIMFLWENFVAKFLNLFLNFLV